MGNTENLILTTQSNNFTLSKIDFKNVYEKRVAYAIIDSVSPYLKNQLTTTKKLEKQGCEVSYQVGMFDVDEITYLAKDLEPNRQYYPLLRKALKDLRENSIEIETKDEFICTSIILKWKFEKNKENITLSIDKELMQFLQDLTHGYTTYQIKTALSLSSIYSMKIYEIICKWRGLKKFYISIEDLRFYTNTIDKYDNVYDLKKRVLEAARKELKDNKDTDLQFNYKDHKEGRNIIGFYIYPIKTKNAFEEQKIKKSVSPRWDLSKELVTALEKQNILLKGATLEAIKEWSSKVHDHNDNDMIHQIGKYVEAAERKNGIGKNYAAYIMGCINRDIKSINH